MGSDQARHETNRILADARRQIYGLLAEDEAGVAGDVMAEAERSAAPSPAADRIATDR